ncbi:hypothetical protein B0T09DRAFT_357269 [Sordaria sp. MPI-SDFR-AT-0083]|nr:hypothetical protein B0T09DRAFT_357269 [Sordaria sp. MPI-SDFR-AT-0083]
MGGVFDRGLDDSAKNAAAVSGTVFIAFAIECTIPLTPSPGEWARHTLHKVWLALVNSTLRMELQEPPIPPTASDADERRRAFANVEEFTATTYERSLCKKTKAE